MGKLMNVAIVGLASLVANPLTARAQTINDLFKRFDPPYLEPAHSKIVAMSSPYTVSLNAPIVHNKQIVVPSFEADSNYMARVQLNGLDLTVLSKTHQIDVEVARKGYTGDKLRAVFEREANHYHGEIFERLQAGIEADLQRNNFKGRPWGVWLQKTTQYVAQELSKGNIDSTYQVTIPIPSRFLVEKMDLEGYVSLDGKWTAVYQNFKGQKHLTWFHPGVGLGGTHRDKSTGRIEMYPTEPGIRYSSRMVWERQWYPPSWSGKMGLDGKAKPESGLHSALGLYAMELHKHPVPMGHGNANGWPADASGHDGTMIHMARYTQGEASHGCIRTRHSQIRDLFSGLIFYNSTSPQQKRTLGTVYPIEMMKWTLDYSSKLPVNPFASLGMQKR